MKRDLLIKEIFNEMALVIIEDVDVSYQQELLISYRDYLIDRYSEYEVDESNFELHLQSFIELEVSRWKNVKQGGKLSLLLSDNSLDKIREISNNGYQCAKNKINNPNTSVGGENDKTVDKEVAQRNIEQLKALLPKVREFNKELASNLVSEGILDYEYASGNDDCVSLRIGRLCH